MILNKRKYLNDFRLEYSFSVRFYIPVILKQKRLFILFVLYSESFRCGVFFAGKNFKDKPFNKLFIIPKRFGINATFHNEDQDDALADTTLPPRYSPTASCPITEPYGTAENPSVHNDTCFWLVS